MRNIAFVIWMIGWPLVYTIDHYLNCQIYLDCVRSNQLDGKLVILVVWILIAVLVYERKPRKG